MQSGLLLEEVHNVYVSPNIINQYTSKRMEAKTVYMDRDHLKDLDTDDMIRL